MFRLQKSELYAKIACECGGLLPSAYVHTYANRKMSRFGNKAGGARNHPNPNCQRYVRSYVFLILPPRYTGRRGARPYRPPIRLLRRPNIARSPSTPLPRPAAARHYCPAAAAFCAAAAPPCCRLVVVVAVAVLVLRLLLCRLWRWPCSCLRCRCRCSSSTTACGPTRSGSWRVW